MWEQISLCRQEQVWLQTFKFTTYMLEDEAQFYENTACVVYPKKHPLWELVKIYALARFWKSAFRALFDSTIWV